MVNIPYIKIPQIHIRGISSARNIYPAQESECGVFPTPPSITYLTQWKIVGNSEVHTLPYPDGVVLPTGYKRCEYLTFDGNSYLNTGVKTANDLTINTAWLTNTRSRLLIGARKSAQSNQLTFGYFIDGEKIIYNYGTIYNVTIIGVDLADMVKHTAIFGRRGLTIDSVFYEQDSKELTEFFDIYLGSWNTNNSSQSDEKRKFIGNIYDTIISNTQGELWHGIPCLDANDVPCFYDIVSQTAFYNQGSGSFTYKLYPQPTEIWSCGEYNATDGKYHILVQPQGGSVADIALDEPLRKTGNTADTLEYPTETSGKALLTIRVEESGGELSPLDTPTTELVDAPQIEEAESYTCVISQGGKAVSWSSFETE